MLSSNGHDGGSGKVAIRGLLLPRRERDGREKVFLLVTRCPASWFPSQFLNVDKWVP